jgi:hypothetical protein
MLFKEPSVPKYIEFPLENGGSILVESTDDPVRTSAGFLKSENASPDNAQKASQSFDASVESMRQAAELMVTKLRSLSAPPDEIDVHFSLKASGEVGSLAVGKLGGDANYSITLKWRADKDAERRREKDDEEEEEKVKKPRKGQRVVRAVSQRPAPPDEDLADDEDEGDESDAD